MEEQDSGGKGKACWVRGASRGAVVGYARNQNCCYLLPRFGAVRATRHHANTVLHLPYGLPPTFHRTVNSFCKAGERGARRRRGQSHFC